MAQNRADDWLMPTLDYSPVQKQHRERIMATPLTFLSFVNLLLFHAAKPVLGDESAKPC